MTNLEKLVDDLSKGAVKFKYVKKDGTVREAFGTTNLGFIPTDKQPHSDNQDKYFSKVITRYYDLDVKDWRSFQNDSLVED